MINASLSSTTAGDAIFVLGNFSKARAFGRSDAISQCSSLPILACDGIAKRYVEIHIWSHVPL